MKEFKALNAKQLDLCLRMLYAEKIAFFVNIVENDKGRIAYIISADIDEHTYENLGERYRILIS